MIIASVESALAAKWLIRSLYGSVTIAILILVYVEYKGYRGEEP